MRLDDAGPRTWLLAGVAGWALAAGLLAVAGMGGRVGPLADDATLLKPLPPLQPAPPLRLGPAGQYDAIAARPLFSTDRKPQPFFLQGEGEPAQQEAFDYVLTSVLITPGLKLAIIQPPDGGQPARVKLDQAPDSHPAWRLIGLAERSAVFEGPEGQRTLELRVYDGIGGERPTQAAPAPGQERIPVTPPPDRGATPAAPVPAKTEESAPEAAVTEQAQMEAIRSRIEQRRAQLRNEPQPQPATNKP